MESDHDRPPSPEFSPLDISEDLVPSRPPKIAGQTSVSFSGLLEPPLLLHEDLKEGCGGQLWPAGMVLAEYLLKDVKKLRGKVILELGAGGGLVGLALGFALSRTKPSLPSQSDPPILITDLPQLLPLQQQNITLNSLSSSVLSASLPWGSPLPNTIPEAYKRPDIVLAADCVYFEPAFPLLLETLRELLVRPSADCDTDSRTKPVCYFCMKKRRTADLRFVTALKKNFDVQKIQVEKKESDGHGAIFLYKVIAKR